MWKKGLGIEVVERNFLPEELKETDAAFFTGTAAEVIGIDSIDNVKMKKPFEESFGAVLSKRYKEEVVKG